MTGLALDFRRIVKRCIRGRGECQTPRSARLPVIRLCRYQGEFSASSGQINEKTQGVGTSLFFLEKTKGSESIYTPCFVVALATVRSIRDPSSAPSLSPRSRHQVAPLHRQPHPASGRPPRTARSPAAAAANPGPAPRHAATKRRCCGQVMEPESVWCCRRRPIVVG